MSYIAPRFQELGPKVLEHWSKLRNPQPGKVYKIMLHDGLDGKVMQCLTWTKNHSSNNIYVLYVTWHNLSKTAINSRRQITSLNLLVSLAGAVTRSRLAPATTREVDMYCAAYPQYTKTLKDYDHAKQDRPDVAARGSAKR